VEVVVSCVNQLPVEVVCGGQGRGALRIMRLQKGLPNAGAPCLSAHRDQQGVPRLSLQPMPSY